MPDTALESRDNATLGAYLMGLREARGVSLDEVSRVTRIGKNYLTAIEQDRFEKLPNQAYIKGFLRVYASYLGVDGNSVIALYEKESGQKPTLRPDQQPYDKVAPAPSRSAGKSVRWFLPFGLFGLIVVIAVLTGKQGGVSNRVQETAAPVASNNDKMSDPRQPVLTSSRVPQGIVPPIPLTTVAAVAEPVATGLVLRLKINQDSWLHLTIDDSISQQYDLKAGDIIEWKAERLIALDVGNAGGVEGVFNGKPLQPLGAPGKTAHLVLKADTL